MSEVIVTTGTQPAQPAPEPTLQPELVKFKIKSTGQIIEMGSPPFPVDIFAPQFVQMPTGKMELSAGDLAGYSQQIQAIEAVLYVRSVNGKQTIFPQTQQDFLGLCRLLGDIGVKRAREQYLKHFVSSAQDDIEEIKKNL